MIFFVARKKVKLQKNFDKHVNEKKVTEKFWTRRYNSKFSFLGAGIEPGPPRWADASRSGFTDSGVSADSTDPTSTDQPSPTTA